METRMDIKSYMGSSPIPQTVSSLTTHQIVYYKKYWNETCDCNSLVECFPEEELVVSSILTSRTIKQGGVAQKD